MKYGLVGPCVALLLVGIASCGDEGQRSPPGPGQTEVLPSDSLRPFQELIREFMRSPCDLIPLRRNNEMHDCQRLLEPDGNTVVFGDLTGIMPDSAMVDRPVDSFSEPEIVAYITSAGTGDGSGNGYAPLGITYTPAATTPAGTPRPPTGQCLWLWNVDVGRWRAALTLTQRAGTQLCPEPAEDDWSGLEVRRETVAGAQRRDYPNTARWQWEFPNERRGQHYIGIKCADGWCLIGQPGFAAAGLPQGDPREVIPGWWDEQFLAIPDPSGDGLVPGPWGKVSPVGPFPHPSDEGGWAGGLRVAEFQIDPLGPGFEVYRGKLHLDDQGHSWVSLGWPPGLGSYMARYGNDGTPNGPTALITTAIEKHGPSESTRWRWHDEDDESGWVPCPVWGCCDVGGAN